MTDMPDIPADPSLTHPPCWAHYRKDDGSVGHCEGPLDHWGDHGPWRTTESERHPAGVQKCPWCGLHVPLIYMFERRHLAMHDYRGSVCEGAFVAAENEETA